MLGGDDRRAEPERMFQRSLALLSSVAILEHKEQETRARVASRGNDNLIDVATRCAQDRGFMSQEFEASVLVIGQVPSTIGHGQVDLVTADTGGRAIELFRMLKFDLVIVNQQLADMPVWNLVQRMRLVMPGQKWAFVGREIGPREEVMARSLGVIGVFDAEADWSELLHVATQIHQRSARNRATSDVRGSAESSPAVMSGGARWN